MLKFAQALRSHTLLGPVMTELVLTGKVGVPNTSASFYGYGFGDDRVNGTRISWHNGETPGINASFDLYRNLDDIVAYEPEHPR